MGRRQIICLGLAGLALMAISTSASAASSITVSLPESETVDTGFKLHGSHGYLISVIAFSEAEPRGTIEITASGRGGRTTYTAPASVTTGSIRADLGSLGRVDVSRHPSGLEKTLHPKCFGGPLTYESGTYEGLIEFNGEQGYTRARSIRGAELPPIVLFASGVACASGSEEAIDAQEPGARLRGISFAHGRSLSFQVNKNSPKARTFFKASLKERRNGIRIDREISGVAPEGAFSFESNLKTATLSPPAPFAGSAFLSRRRNSVSPIWAGNLRLAFPGRRAVPIAGPGVHVGLVHATFNRNRGAHAEIGS